MKRILVISFIVIFSCFLLADISPAHAGWRDVVKNKVSSTKKKVKDKASSFKKKTSSSYKKAKERTQDKYKTTKRKAKDKYNSAKQRSKDKYNSAKANAKKRYDKTKQRSKQIYSSTKTKAYNSVKKTKQKTKDRIGKTKGALKEYVEKGHQKKGTLLQAVASKKDAAAYKVSQKVKGLSQQAKQKITFAREQYGPKAEQGLANLYSVAGKKRNAIEKQLNSNIKSASKWAKDPNTRKKVVSGMIVASAVAYYGYKHQEDVKYLIINSTLESVKVPVNGEMVSAEDLVRNAIIQQAPFLSNTTLAEDPSAVLAYGVTATTKDDLMNKVALVPDGKGGVVSVNTAISQATGSEDALAALQISNSLEGMAMSAAEDGHMGIYGQQFAGTYAMMEERGNGE